MEFTPTNAASLALSETRLRGYVEEEASFGRIIVDAQGLTAGTKLHILQPARALLAKWKEARSGFDTAIEPKLADIHAVENLQREIDALKQRRAADVAQIEQTWEANQEHRAIRKRWEEAEAVYNQSRLNNGMRDARMAVHRPTYIIAMFCIGVAEWLINYDTFFLFVGVPAIAAGATLILGVLLAFSAHGHGELFKQWSHRFGQDQTQMNRLGGYRLLGLSTLGLLIVLSAAGGSRYAAALHSLATQPAHNILGEQAMVEISPLRDVLISLLANLAAWAVGSRTLATIPIPTSWMQRSNTGELAAPFTDRAIGQITRSRLSKRSSARRWSRWNVLPVLDQLTSLSNVGCLNRSTSTRTVSLRQ
jgi:hypothetical protein